MSELKRSGYFDIPVLSWFGQGNRFTGSENTFNFRLEPAKEKLTAYVWYGLSCFELADKEAQLDGENTEEGLAAAITFIDDEYEKYKQKLASGEVEGRRTYKPAHSEHDTGNAEE